jgi:hypothetical protein
MPGLHWATFWEGNRAELFATYILSSVAAVVPVPRTADYGLDLLCTLTRRDNRALYAGKAFGVQVKSVSNPEIKYGGINNKGNWKDYEINWLFGQEQPILLCIVNLKEWRVRLYSTMRMWWLRWMKGSPGEVVLVPDFALEDYKDQTEENRYPFSPLANIIPDQSYGDGYSYRVPLGKPIVDIFLKEQEAEVYRDKLHECLNRWIELEYRNITHRRMNIPYSEEWMGWETNVPPELSARIWHYWNSTADENVPTVLLSIAPAISSLLINLKAQNQTEKLEAILPIAQLAKAYDFLNPMGTEVLSELTGPNNTNLASGKA